MKRRYLNLCALACLASACSPAPPPASASQLASGARQSVLAGGYHLTVNGVEGSASLRVEADVTSAGARGAFERGSDHVDFTYAGGKLYFRGAKFFATQALKLPPGAGKQALSSAGDRWVLLEGGGGLDALKSLVAPKALAACYFPESTPFAKGPAVNSAGIASVELKGERGFSTFVTASAPFRPSRVDSPDGGCAASNGAGNPVSLEFSRFGEVPRVDAPPDVLDLSGGK